jgi:hypothetical protein
MLKKPTVKDREAFIENADKGRLGSGYQRQKWQIQANLSIFSLTEEIKFEPS